MARKKGVRRTLIVNHIDYSYYDKEKKSEAFGKLLLIGDFSDIQVERQVKKNLDKATQVFLAVNKIDRSKQQRFMTEKIFYCNSTLLKEGGIMEELDD